MLCKLLLADEVDLLLYLVHVHPCHPNRLEVFLDDAIGSNEIFCTEDVLEAHPQTFQLVIVRKVL